MKKFTFITLLLVSTCFSNNSIANSTARSVAIGTSVTSLLIWNPMRLDSVGFDYGVDGDGKFERTRILWLWGLTEKKLGMFNLAPHIELAMGQILPSDPNVNVGITPMLEWQYPINNITLLAETGLGINWLSKKQHHERILSTNMHFGQTLGLGLRWENYQASLRYQHISNADTVRPNNGYNFFGFSIKYHY